MATGPLMLKFESRSVLTFCGLMYAAGLFMFLLSVNFNFLVVGRSLSGLAQAIICAYGPVWVNEFAPRKSQATWMGFL